MTPKDAQQIEMVAPDKTLDRYVGSDKVLISDMYEEILPITKYEVEDVISGGLSYETVYLEYLVETAHPTDSSVTTLPRETPDVENSFEAKLYPNPTASFSTLSIQVQQPGQFTIEVYSVTGQKITEIHNGELKAGRHDFEIDLTDYITGTYLVKAFSANQDETLKVVKVE